LIEDISGDGETQVTQGNQLRILSLIQRAGGVEMVDTTEVAIALALSAALGLAFVVVVAGDVGEKIHGPSEQLLKEEVGDGGDGGLLHQLIQIVDGLANARSVLVPGLGHEHHVTGEVTSGLVMLAVGDLPGEVGHQQSGMADPADSVIQNLGGGESLVATLVSQNPDTGTDHTLDNGIDGPQDHSRRQRGDGFRSDIVVEGIEDGRQDGNIAEDIVQAGGGTALIAMSGDGVSDLLDSVIGDLELVSIGVQHLALVLRLRRHGG
jgi:hypothetical protein